jgi:hypothetical protein
VPLNARTRTRNSAALNTIAFDESRPPKSVTPAARY